MFRIPKTNVIDSDEGFSVEVLGRTGIKYTENNKTIEIDAEILAGPSGLVIYKDSIQQWNSSENAIDYAIRDKIVDNIKRAFQYRGINIQVI